MKVIFALLYDQPLHLDALVSHGDTMFKSYEGGGRAGFACLNVQARELIYSICDLSNFLGCQNVVIPRLTEKLKADPLFSECLENDPTSFQHLGQELQSKEIYFDALRNRVGQILKTNQPDSPHVRNFLADVGWEGYQFWADFGAKREEIAENQRQLEE